MAAFFVKIWFYGVTSESASKQSWTSAVNLDLEVWVKLGREIRVTHKSGSKNVDPCKNQDCEVNRCHRRTSQVEKHLQTQMNLSVQL